MKSQKLGKNTLLAEITNISSNGVWLYISGKEYFLPYDLYPWFKKATVDQVYDVKLLRKNHLHWPQLDVDIEVESLEYPDKYPLIYRA